MEASAAETHATVGVAEAPVEGAHHESAVTSTVIDIVSLLLVAAITTLLVKRLPRLPLTIALVLIGVLLGQLAEAGIPGLASFAEARLTPELVLFVFIPTLIFESAFALDARALRRNLLPVLILAIPGLLLSTGIIGLIMWSATDFTLIVALLLGAILSATDPVAVIALFKQLGTPERLTVLVEGESLFNDATSLVLATVFIGMLGATAEFGAATLLADVAEFLLVFFGGIVVGWLAALVAGTMMSLVQGDAFLEITVTTILAYVSFLVAEHVLHVSGIMAVVAAGITMNSWGRTKITPDIADFMEHFWEYLANVANALIFLMVGLRVELAGIWANLDLIGFVILAMLVSRAVVVFGLVPLAGRLSEPVEMAYQKVMYWGGLRGAIALAIVLALPESEIKETLISIVMGAVLFTLLVQGLSIESLVKRLKLDQPPMADALARLHGLQRARRQALEMLPALQAGGMFSARVANEVRTENQDALNLIEAQMADRYAGLTMAEERQVLLLRTLGLSKFHLWEMFREGHLSERAFRELDAAVSVALDRVRHEGDLPGAEIGEAQTRRYFFTLLRWLGRLPGTIGLVESLRSQRAARDYDVAWARHQSAGVVLEDIDDIAHDSDLSPDVVESVRHLWEAERDQARELVDQTAEQFPEFVSAVQRRTAERLALVAQAEAVESAARDGLLPEGVAEQLIEEKRHELAEIRGGAVEGGLLTADPSELLRKVPFFQDMPEDMFATVAARLRPHTHPANEDVIREGEAGNSLFLIARGVMAVMRDARGPEPTRLATLVAGDFFGEMALLHGEPRNATVRAITPSTTYELHRDDLMSITGQFPAIRRAIEAVDAERQRANAEPTLTATPKRSADQD